MVTVQRTTDHDELKQFAQNMLQGGSLLPRELLLLSIWWTIPLLPWVTKAALIEDIARKASGALDHWEKVAFLTEQFSWLVFELYRK